MSNLNFWREASLCAFSFATLSQFYQNLNEQRILAFIDLLALNTVFHYRHSYRTREFHASTSQIYCQRRIILSGICKRLYLFKVLQIATKSRDLFQVKIFPSYSLTDRRFYNAEENSSELHFSSQPLVNRHAKARSLFNIRQIRKWQIFYKWELKKKEERKCFYFK